MLEEKEKYLEETIKENISEETSLEVAIDKSLSTLPLETTEKKIIDAIIEAPTKEDLQRQFELFNNNQVKKNALRIIKLNNLLSKVEDQAIERFENRPDQVSNKELLDYISVVSNQIERAQNFNRETLTTDIGNIKINNQKNEININVAPTLDREGKEHVMDAISALLKQLNHNKDDIIEAEEVSTESAEKVTNTNENIVYSNKEQVESFDTNEESEI